MVNGILSFIRSTFYVQTSKAIVFPHSLRHAFSNRQFLTSSSNSINPMPCRPRSLY